MNKKFLIFLMVAILTLTAFVGCSNQQTENSDNQSETENTSETTSETTSEATSSQENSSEEISSEPEHKHIATTEYMNFDLESHYYLCECGEKIDEAQHKFEDTYCEECKVGVVEFDDGWKELAIYGEKEEPILSKIYDDNGELVTETVYEYEYDENQNLKKMTIYEDGVLVTENEYSIDELTGLYMSQSIEHHEDGKIVSEYDKWWNLIKETEYNTRNEVLSVTRYEYTYGEDGIVLGKKIYEDGELARENEYIADDDGTTYIVKAIVYSETAIVLTENTYDEDYNFTLSKVYSNGVLTSETQFSLHSLFDTPYISLVTMYGEDGSKVVSELDEDGNLVKMWVYDSKGNLIG